MSARRYWWWMFAALLAARIAAFGWIAQRTDGLLATAHDEHAQIARNLALGDGFRFNFFGSIDAPDSTSQQAPLVPSVLAACYIVLGIESSAALLTVVALQLMMTLLAALALSEAASGSTAPRYALAVGWFSGLYPPFLVSGLHIQALPWNLAWLAFMLAGVCRLRTERNDGPLLLIVGGAGGLLTDPILAAPFGLLLFLTAVQGRPRTSVAVACAVGLLLTPWLVRGYAVHGRITLVKDSLPYVFWQGNTLRSEGTDKLPVADADRNLVQGSRTGDLWTSATAARGRALAINDVALSPTDLAELAALPDEISRMDWFGRRIRAELAADPAHYFRMCGKRFVAWVWFDPTNPKSYLWPYRASYIGLILLAAVGIASVRRTSLWMPLLLSLATLTAVHVAVITSARFRILAELCVAPVAAFGFLRLVALCLRWFPTEPHRWFHECNLRPHFRKTS